MITDYFQNLLRVFLFAFMVGVVFAILSMLTGYSIPDTTIRSAIFEERVFNALQKNPPSSFEEITPIYLAKLITGDKELRKNDVIAFRLKFFDPNTRKEVKFLKDNKEIKYDADVYYENPELNKEKSKMSMFFPLTGEVKSNYVSVVNPHTLQNKVTGEIYIVQFEFIARAN